MNHTIWPEYKKQRNEVTSEIRKAAEAYSSIMVDDNSNDPKGMWKVVNNVLNRSNQNLYPLPPSPMKVKV